MRTLALVLSVLLLLLSGCQTLPRTTGGSVEVATDNARFKLYFTDRERQLIHRHYRDIKGYKNKHNKKHKKTKHMPPGLAKREHLPPGLRKHLVKNGSLPPGLQGRSLPIDLNRHMHWLPSDYVRVVIGSDIVLMNKKTRVIFDVILDAVLD